MHKIIDNHKKTVYSFPIFVKLSPNFQWFIIIFSQFSLFLVTFVTNFHTFFDIDPWFLLIFYQIITNFQELISQNILSIYYQFLAFVILFCQIFTHFSSMNLNNFFRILNQFLNTFWRFSSPFYSWNAFL